MMPSEPKLANPHIVWSMISHERGPSALAVGRSLGGICNFERKLKTLISVRLKGNP